MSYNVTSNKSGSRVTIHCTNTASIVIPGNSLQSNIASVGETLTGAYITQIQYACPPEQYIRISRGGYLVGVFESSNFIDFAGAGMPLSKGADKDLLIEFIGLGAEKGFCNIELKKVFTELDLPEPAPEPPVPAFSLNFLNPVLDPRVTFSRGTPATLIDRTGRLTYAPNNLVTWSEDFSNAIWTSNSAGLTVATDATVAPNGTTTADKLAETATTDTHRRGFALSSLARVQYVFSVYAKAAERTILRGWSFSGGDTNEQTFNLANGTCTGSLNPTITPVGDGWYRCAFIVPAANAGSVVFGPSDGTGGTNAYSGVAGSGIFVWGAQLEPVTYQTTASTYNATTSAAYYGPRFDYDPVTLGARGLLIEEARTNLLLQSGDLTSFSITPATGLTSTSNATVAPDGTNTARRIINTVTTEQHRLFQTVTLTAATPHTFTVYVKNDTAGWCQISFFLGAGTTAYANINLATGALGSTGGGTSYSVTPAGNGWYRLRVTATTDNTGCNLQIYAIEADVGQANPSTTGTVKGIYVWGAQLEAGSFATSYIPTIASTVTRNIDIATVTGTNFSSWYNQSEGTFITNATTVNPDINFYTMGTGGGRIAIRRLGSNTALGYNRLGGSNDVIPVGTWATGTAKIAYAIKSGDQGISLNGGAVSTNFSAFTQAETQLHIGSLDGTSAPMNGHIRVIDYYNTRLPGVQLQSLSAPSLAPTLSLDFTSGNYNVGF